MNDLKATAYRKYGRIIVDISGNLGDSCMDAEVIDKYPGGRVYFVDPGAAQVFIREKKFSLGSCLDVLIPWAAQVHLFDTEHEQVEIFINEEKRLTISIK